MNNKIGTIAALLTLLMTAGAVSATSMSLGMSPATSAWIFQGGKAATNPIHIGATYSFSPALPWYTTSAIGYVWRVAPGYTCPNMNIRINGMNTYYEPFMTGLGFWYYPAPATGLSYNCKFELDAMAYVSTPGIGAYQGGIFSARGYSGLITIAK